MSLEIIPKPDAKSEFNWIGIIVPVDNNTLSKFNIIRQDYKDLNVVSEPGINGEDPYHITIYYGFDHKYFEQIKQMVLNAKLTMDELKIVKDPYAITPPHSLKNKYICYDIESEKLTILKQNIEKLTGKNKTETKYNRIIPFHVTLLSLAC